MTLADSKFGPVKYFCLALVCLLTFGLATACCGQDESLEELKKQWGEMETAFVEKAAAIKSGEGDTKALRNEYLSMIDQANLLIDKLRQASLQAFEADPKNTTAIETLMGILINDAQSGQADKVLAIGQQLIAKDIDPQYFRTAAQVERISESAKMVFETLLVRQLAAKVDPNNETSMKALMEGLLKSAANGQDEVVLSIGDQLIAKGVEPVYFENAAGAEQLSIDAKEIFEELLIRQREAKADDLPRVKLTTTQGDIVVELFENQAPNTVANFISLVESGYYTDLLFHRVLEGFMAQTGGFKADGSVSGEGPGYSIECECYSPETRPHFSNSLSMAHAGRDTGGGQFFLTFSRTDFLDGKHTCFGRIISGDDVLDQLQITHLSINGQEQPIPGIEKDKIISAEVIRKRDHEYKPKKVGEQEPVAEAPAKTPDLTPPDAGKSAQPGEGEGQESTASDKESSAESDKESSDKTP